jgi:HAD superfamily hydrolase (TIGR01459 family)
MGSPSAPTQATILESPIPVPAPTILTSAADFLAGYDVLLCDVWGVLHDGRVAYASANDSLPRYRARGGKVVLVSNAPMTGVAIAKLLGEKGVQRDCWDAIVGSGDIAIAHIAAEKYAAVYGIGPRPRDNSFFDAVPKLVDELAAADAIACTGLLHEHTETAEDYRPLLEKALARNLPFVCVNPDLAVHVGADLLPCAGAIAALYESMGGTVFWCGKPHPSAYAMGLQVAEKLCGGAVDLKRVLGIGDAIRTDLASAAGAGVDALFIAQGLHRDEVIVAGKVDPERLSEILTRNNAAPKATMVGLSW